MNTGTKDVIEVAGSIVTIVVGLFFLLDFFLNRWRYVKRMAVWFGKQTLPDYGSCP